MKNLYFLLSSIKNNLERQKLLATVPYSKINLNVLELMFQDGYIIGYNRNLQNPSLINVKLRFTLGNYLKALTFYSKKLTSCHVSHSQLKPILHKVNYGVITTNLGVLTLKQAYSLGVGGQILFTF